MLSLVTSDLKLVPVFNRKNYQEVEDLRCQLFGYLLQVIAIAFPLIKVNHTVAIIWLHLAWCLQKQLRFPNLSTVFVFFRSHPVSLRNIAKRFYSDYKGWGKIKSKIQKLSWETSITSVSICHISKYVSERLVKWNVARKFFHKIQHSWHAQVT